MTGAASGVRDALLTALGELGLEPRAIGDDAWWLVLVGEHKREIPVVLRIGDRSLRATAFATPAPDENREDVYRLLLTRNRHHAPACFALDDNGEVIVAGRLSTRLLETEHVDELLGVVLALVDDAFDRVLRAGFASYIDAEQRWRARVGLPPNPVSGDAAHARETHAD